MLTPLSTLSRDPDLTLCFVVTQHDIETYLFLLGAPSMSFVGYGVSRWKFTSLENYDIRSGVKSRESPYFVSAPSFLCVRNTLFSMIMCCLCACVVVCRLSC